MIPAATQTELNSIAQKYATELLGRVQGVLSGNEYKNKGELLDSLKVSVIPSTDNDAPIILLEYADQGYFIGYKNPQWTKLANVGNLEEWAQTKTFSKIPGYGTSSTSLPLYKQQQRVAYAIAIDKQKNDAWKPKRWKRAAGLGDLLKSINAESMEAYVKACELILAKAITTGEVLS